MFRVATAILCAPVVGVAVYLLVSHILTETPDSSLFDHLAFGLVALMPVVFVVTLPLSIFWYACVVSYTERSVPIFGAAGCAVSFPLCGWATRDSFSVAVLFTVLVSGFLAGIVFWAIAEFADRGASVAP